MCRHNITCTRIKSKNFEAFIIHRRTHEYSNTTFGVFQGTNEKARETFLV